MSIGYQRLFAPSDRGPVSYGVWYPSNAAALDRSFPYLRATVAADAPVAPGVWPVIIFSHGWSECGCSSVALCLALARAGFMVAAPDHEDASNCHAEQAGWSWPVPLVNPTLEAYPNRHKDCSAVLTHLQTSFAPLVNTQRVAVIGHSIGGWTAWAMAGGLAECVDPRVSTVVAMMPTTKVSAEFIQGVAVPSMFLGSEYGSNYGTPDAPWPYASLPIQPKWGGYVHLSDHYGCTDKPYRAYNTAEQALIWGGVLGAVVSAVTNWAKWRMANDQTARAALVATTSDKHYLGVSYAL